MNYRTLLTSELVRIARTKVWEVPNDETRELLLELVERMETLLGAIKELGTEQGK